MTVHQTPTPEKADWEDLDGLQTMRLISNPIMVADADMIIRFVNEPAYRMFEAIEADIQRDLPHFRAREVVGQSIDLFHKNPAYQRGIMHNLAHPHDGKFTVGGRHMAFRATPNLAASGKSKGVIVEWQDRTQVVEAQNQIAHLLEEINHMVQAHDRGDIDVFMDASRLNEEFGAVAAGVNSMVQQHIDTKKKVVATATEFAKGNLDAPLEAFPRKKAFLNVAMEAIRNNLKEVFAEIERLSSAIVAGNLDVKADPSRFSGAYRGLIETFETTFQSLNAAFGVISSQVGQVAVTVEELSRSSQSLANNAQIQSTAVDQVSASSEETESQVRANAQAANRANQLVVSAANVAADGREKIAQMVTAMQGIRVSSQDIAKIIKVIDEIAFQTNLLALNAAVEAARAGQHGRGFAVVAQEVRNLAGRSAKAARETSDLIDDATTRVQAGVKIADETAVAFSTIAGDIEQVKAIVRDISTASEEQSRGVAQINTAIGEIAKTALSTSQQADELAAGSAEMAAATETMRAEVARFKLRKVDTHPEPIMSLDMIPPAMMAQLKAMFTTMQKDQPATPSWGVAHANGSLAPLDHDRRGFGNF